MIVYWLLFLYFAFGALMERRKDSLKVNADPLFWVGGVLITLVIGLRYKVGADWVPYEIMLEDASKAGFSRIVSGADPGYMLLNWLAGQIGADLWLVNLICGAIFTFGLMRFAQVQERPWLSVLIAIPYLVVVVAMGYTRQSVSIGLVMAGLASYVRRGSSIRFALYVLVAASFHKTAVVAMPLIAFGDRRSVFLSLALIAGVTYLLYSFFLSRSVGLLVTNYIESRYSSQGAGVRVAMSTLPSILYLFRSASLNLSERERRIWRNMAIAALALVPALWLVSSSTAIDRLALYVLPIQMVVFSRPRVLNMEDRLGTSLIIAYAALILFAWLTFAVHARFWVPYRFWPLS